MEVNATTLGYDSFTTLDRDTKVASNASTRLIGVAYHIFKLRHDAIFLLDIFHNLNNTITRTRRTKHSLEHPKRQRVLLRSMGGSKTVRKVIKRFKKIKILFPRQT